MKTKNATFTLIITLFISFTGMAQIEVDREFEQKMDTFIKQVTDSLTIKFGIGMAVVKGENTVYDNYHGMADYENQVKVTEETNFYIASSTKSFTALALLMLDKKGMLDLDRSLSSYFPEGDFAPELKADQVNLRDLLYHTSGLENNNITYSKAYTGLYTLESLTQNLINFTIPERKASYGEFKYSNLGYNIIELIVERELGKTWKEVVFEEVLQPLGMNRTSANISDIERFNWQGAEPYDEMSIKGELNLVPLKKKDKIMHAAGGLISTPMDMTKFLKVQLNGGQLNGKQVFPRDLIEFSQEPHAKQDRNFLGLHRFGYGYGWNLATAENGDTLIHHYGGFPGTTAQVAFMPEHGVGISIFANEGMKGLLATFLISSYAFDFYAGRENLDRVYIEKLAQLKTRINQGYEQIEKGREKRAQRTWDLDLQPNDYAGTYYSSSIGQIKIDCTEQNELSANIGFLKSAFAEPFTKKNSMRVELIPGSGTVIQFNVEQGKVTSMKMDGLVFKRVN